MNNGIIISRCESIAIAKREGHFKALFHFKGFYKGVQVQRIFIECFKDDFKVGNDYLLRASDIKYFQGDLYCKVNEFRDLNDIKLF